MLPAYGGIDREKRLTERGEMPREQINYPDLTQKDAQRELRSHQGHDLAESDFGPWNESSLHVGWQGLDRHTGNSRYGLGWVQVGLEVDLEYVRFAMSSPNGADSDRTIMYTPVLSPAEIDRLISTLRKARRKAFRDE